MSLSRTYRRWNAALDRWEYPVMHHLDGDPANNDVANLQIAWPGDKPLTLRDFALRAMSAGSLQKTGKTK